jgi:hypothetical protein
MVKKKRVNDVRLNLLNALKNDIVWILTDSPERSVGEDQFAVACEGKLYYYYQIHICYLYNHIYRQTQQIKR